MPTRESTARQIAKRNAEKVISIEDLTTKAVHTVLDMIDEATDRTSKKREGPCGDVLAYKLHETILAALHAHFKHPDMAPAFVRAADIKVECFMRDLENADRNFSAKVAEAYADLERHEQHVAEQRTLSKCSQEGG